MALLGEQPGLRLVSGPAGANNSTQYLAVVGYASLHGDQAETIKVEVALREPLLTAAGPHPAETLLLNPNSGGAIVPPLAVTSLSRQEAMAEKLRAALSRREVAVRDFFDIDHAARHLGLRAGDTGLMELVSRKLAVPGNEPMDVSSSRLDALRMQLASRLKPVLRERDFVEFDLERAFSLVADVAAAVAARQPDRAR